MPWRSVGFVARCDHRRHANLCTNMYSFPTLTYPRMRGAAQLVHFKIGQNKRLHRCSLDAPNPQGDVDATLLNMPS